jgi:hypothetical protein
MQLQNYLNPVEFRFTINRLPNTKFFVQSAIVPDMSTGVTEQMTPFKTIYRPGDKITFGEFTITVIADENLDSFIETYNWLIGLTKPESFEQYANLIAGDGLYSDATLTLLSSAKNPNVDIVFYDMFPISIGQIPLNITSSSVDAPTFDITFKYSSYKINVT